MIRSLLFTPATRLDRLQKALSSGADMVILDLEDGVGPSDKSAARAALAELARRGFDGEAGRIGVRINSLGSADGIRDMAAMLDWPAWPSLLAVPKVQSGFELRQVQALAGRHPTRLLITLETALGVARAVAILAEAPRSAIVGYGSADHTAETGAAMSGTGLAWARGQIVNAAATAGIPAVDGVWLDYGDLGGLETEARLVKSMGFSGKIAIHPAQVATINTVFSPTEAEIETARAMVAASRAAGDGAFSFNGKMVDAPVLARARRMVD